MCRLCIFGSESSSVIDLCLYLLLWSKSIVQIMHCPRPGFGSTFWSTQILITNALNTFLIHVWDIIDPSLVTRKQGSHIRLYAELQDGILLPELLNFMHYTRHDVHVVCMLMSSACHLHLQVICMSSGHVICSTPHGQHGPKLSFYSDRIWLLNGICHKNVELFHFRII